MPRATLIKWGNGLGVTDLGGGIIRVDLGPGGSGSGHSDTIQFGDGLGVTDLGGGVARIDVGAGGSAVGHATDLQFGDGLVVTDLGAGVIRVDFGDIGDIGDVVHDWLFIPFPAPTGTTLGIPGGISDGNLAVVSATVSGVSRGYLWDVDANTITELDPFAGFSSSPTTISRDGLPVGYCYRFRTDLSSFTQELRAASWADPTSPVQEGPSYVDPPAGALDLQFFGTGAFAVNNLGDVGGTFYDPTPGQDVGGMPFIGAATIPALATFRRQVVGHGNPGLWGLNDAGHACGATIDTPFNTTGHAWYWDGSETVIVSAPWNTDPSDVWTGMAINAADEVACAHVFGDECGKWDPVNGFQLDAATTTTVRMTGLNDAGDRVWGDKTSTQAATTANGSFLENVSGWPGGPAFDFPAMSAADVNANGYVLGVVGSTVGVYVPV